MLHLSWISPIYSQQYINKCGFEVVWQLSGQVEFSSKSYAVNLQDTKKNHVRRAKKNDK